MLLTEFIIGRTLFSDFCQFSSNTCQISNHDSLVEINVAVSVDELITGNTRILKEYRKLNAKFIISIDANQFLAFCLHSSSESFENYLPFFPVFPKILTKNISFSIHGEYTICQHTSCHLTYLHLCISKIGFWESTFFLLLFKFQLIQSTPNCSVCFKVSRRVVNKSAKNPQKCRRKKQIQVPVKKLKSKRRRKSLRLVKHLDEIRSQQSTVYQHSNILIFVSLPNVQDKTFGLKNKKGGKSQKFIAQVEKQVKSGGLHPLQPVNAKKEEKEKKLQEQKELLALFRLGTIFFFGKN